MKRILTVLFFVICSNSYSQTYDFEGKIVDIKSDESLAFVTVKVDGTNAGTTSADDGSFRLKLGNGLHRVIFSMIGYFSDTAVVNIDGDNVIRDIYLKPSEIFTEIIEVPGENPAYEIIRKAIEYKKQFKRNLNEYELNAYTKMILRSNQMSVVIPDSLRESQSELGILGIMESETDLYFRKPNQTKQIVTSKRETANITRGFALPYILNFYDETFDFGNTILPGPLNDNAFSSYDYRLTGTTSFDSLTIFKIEVINRSEREPQFFGEIFIADSIFALMRVDLKTNSATDIRVVKNINFKQSFSSYKDNNGNSFWMPTDVQIYADGSIGGLFKIEAEVYTIVTNYKINVPAPRGIFDDFIIKVEPDAGKEAGYWADNSLIRATNEEEYAFTKIDEEQEKKKREFSIGLTSINYGLNFSSSPLSYWEYNRVEGNRLSLNAHYNTSLNREVITGNIGYGLSDKKIKFNISASKRFLRDRSLRLYGSIFRSLMRTARDPDELRILTNSGEAIGYKVDDFDYYYSSGYRFGLDYFPSTLIGIALMFDQQKQFSAATNTEFSILKSSDNFNPNPPVNEAFLRRVGVRININPNSGFKIDWGDGDISQFTRGQLPKLELEYEISPKSLGSNYEFRRYTAILSGANRINYFLNFRYTLGGEYLSGDVPYQELGHLSNYNGRRTPEYGIRTMRYHEYLGDKVYYFKFENNFGKLLFGGIPLLENFNLIGFFNAARVDVSDGNKEIAAYKFFKQTDGLYMEAGFGIGRLLEMFRVDLAWRLNNFQKGQNFNISLSWDNF